jgi:hypothetical protein
MKYSKNKKYRDQEVIIEKEIITLNKRIKKKKVKKEGFFKKIVNFLKRKCLFR